MKYQVLGNYQKTRNVGDAIQSIAIQRLLGTCEYADHSKLSEYKDFSPTLVANGYLLDNESGTPKRTARNVLFAGIYIADGVHKNDVIEWVRRSHYEVGARDPATQELLANNGIVSDLIGCPTLAFERYTGPRSGTLRIDTDGGSDDLSQLFTTHPTPWKIQLKHAKYLLERYKKAELVITKRLHVALPCIAFGTPVVILRSHGVNTWQPQRLSLIEAMGLPFNEPVTFDPSGWVRKYKAFLERNLKTNKA